MTQTPADDAELSYEAARAQLVEVVAQLESGKVPLSESMALWERGEKLAALCQEWLTGAAETIEKARRAPAASESGRRAPAASESGLRAPTPGGPDADAQA